MKKITYKNKAFSLIELLAALVISSMVLVAVLGTYNHIQRSSTAIVNKLDYAKLPRDTLQLIAEDLDEIITNNENVKINFQSKKDQNGYNTARLEITKFITDKTNIPVPIEKIVWQTAYDYDSDSPGLVLYRSYDGLNLEDKLLEQDKPPFEKGLFVPICPAVTCFQVQTKNGPDLIDNWSAPALPQNIVVTISFAQPVEISPNQWEVPQTQKTIKTVVIDRTKKIRFVIEKKEFPTDANYIKDTKQPDIQNINNPDANFK
jgi:prepilin-type N-terminal cleavage/methylation domain-containing protein